jgi:hypothetical protein
MKLIIGGLCLINALLACLYFVSVSETYAEVLKAESEAAAYLNTGDVFWVSLASYIFAIFTGALCIVLAEA